MGQPCEIVYRFNADESKNEVVVDMRGEEIIPERNQVIQRKGGVWKVVMVTTHVNAKRPVPIHYVTLTDKF